uniref:ADP-ribosylation factor-binding protein GGA1 n=1 Tax=Oncorhynchus tshawytscha TaxID=74940 RepID=A0A8C8C3T4_ONCTS
MRQCQLPSSTHRCRGGEKGCSQSCSSRDTFMVKRIPVVMAAPPDTGSLEARINKATNPLNRDTDWDSIQAFCDQLNNDLEGPQLATRLLAHKIQSPQEWEAMQALVVLETCMKSCGERFHSEVGKFRFLNELIKVVSPKYLGSRAPEPVKKKVLELIYSWTLGLPDEAKIADAYEMLKKQGIVKQDPVLPADKLLLLPPPRPKNAIFEDEEKSKTLTRLLNSTQPEDLKAANKLIQEMVQEDQKQAEKLSKRVNAIQDVNESVSLLTQLDTSHSAITASPIYDVYKDLYQRCEKMRPTLFRLASDTEDNDEALAEILQANDSLTQVINLYRQQVKGEVVNGNNSANTQRLTGSSVALLDLSGLDTSPPSPEFPTPTDSLNAPSQEMGISLLDDELMSLGKSSKTSATSMLCDSTTWDSFQSSDSVDIPDIPAAPSVLLSPDPLPYTQPLSTGATSGSSALDELDQLGKTLLQQSLPPEGLQVKWDKPPFKPTLRDLQNKSGTNPSLIPAFSPEHPVALLVIPPIEMILTDVFVPLESIKPSSLLPVTVFDSHSLRVLFHFARDSLPSLADVLVVIISMLSSAPVPVSNILFQAFVPDTMRVKLQPPSETELPAFNPILPPAAITQILLLANPHKEKVQLQYKLTFTLGEEDHDERGVVAQFPPSDTWGNL